MQDKPKWLTTTVEFLLDNVAVLATIAYATYVVYWQEFGNGNISTDQLITAVIAVLALLATSEIIERYRRLSKIEKSTDSIVALVQKQIERPSASRFFEPIPNLDPYVRKAHTIDLMGLSLTSMLNKQLSNLKEANKAGAAIRVIVANPARKSLAIKMSALRSEQTHNEGYFQKRLASSFEDIEYLNKSHQFLPANKGSFDVHLLDYAPSFGIMAFDVNQDTGMIFIEVYPHGTGYDTQIAFNLTRSRDGEWFRYFQRQFEDVWQKTATWSPRPLPTA
jgi:hypothetical protein